MSLLVLYAVPLTGLARVDLVGGEHRALGKPVDIVAGMTAILVGMASLYLVTFLANIFFGRLFCGWGCPVGQVSRFAEQLELRSRGRGQSLRRHLEGGLFALALAGGILAWWVDPAVLVSGNFPALAAVSSAALALVLLAYLHGRFWRWSFCRKVCPIGLYYSVVHVRGPTGIHFHPELETCKSCDACQMACPVRLDPRRLDDEQHDIGGLAFEGLPGDHHCLRCGDCIQACEFIFRREPGAALPLTFDAFGAPESAREEPAEPPVEAAERR